MEYPVGTEVIRTYEHFVVRFDRGTSVSPFDTYESAAAWLGDEPGVVERVTFDYSLIVGTRLYEMARPGISERVA